MGYPSKTMETSTPRHRTIAALGFTFGMLFPIDVLGVLNPLAIDLSRYGLAVFILMAVKPNSERRSETAFLATWLLVLVNSLIIIRSALSEHLTFLYPSIIGIVSIVLAYQITKNAPVNRYILTGLLFGATLSAFDIILQVLGLPYLGTETDWGTRYAGLGINSTNTAPFLALGLILVISNFLWQRSCLNILIRLSTGSILIVGLLLSGGRGGLACILLALVVWLVTQFYFRPLLVLSLGSLGLIWVLTRTQHILDFLIREDSTSGFTTGRDALNAMAWSAMTSGGILGIDLGERQMFRPHTPILSFGLSAGVLGFIVATLLSCVILWRLFSTPAEDKTSSTLLRMIAAVILVTTLLEPWGFFIGLGKCVILVIVFSGKIGYRFDSSQKPGMRPSSKNLRPSLAPARSTRSSTDVDPL